MEAVETRVAVIAIIVREGTQVAALNDLLHQYGPYIVGRMGVPYREKGVNIISVAMDAPGDVISALSGKLGRLEGVTAKVYFQTADLFAWTVTIVAVSVAFERLFLALVDRLMGKAGL